MRALPLADKGFVPTGEGNPVRWYVEDEQTGRLHGPFADMARADEVAAEWEEQTARAEERIERLRWRRDSGV